MGLILWLAIEVMKIALLNWQWKINAFLYTCIYSKNLIATSFKIPYTKYIDLLTLWQLQFLHNSNSRIKVWEWLKKNWLQFKCLCINVPSDMPNGIKNKETETVWKMFKWYLKIYFVKIVYFFFSYLSFMLLLFLSCSYWVFFNYFFLFLLSTQAIFQLIWRLSPYELSI